VLTGVPAAQASHGGFFFAFFGLPIAYVVEALVGLPLYARYARAGGLRPATVVGIASLMGAAVMPLVWVAFLGGRPEWLMAGIGAVMGAAAGGTFVLVAGTTHPVSSHLTDR
jgi:hypothetical protein